jgi:hypothetical protein
MQERLPLEQLARIPRATLPKIWGLRYLKAYCKNYPIPAPHVPRFERSFAFRRFCGATYRLVTSYS